MWTPCQGRIKKNRCLVRNGERSVALPVFSRRGDVQEMGGGDRQGAGKERVRGRAEQREDGSRERRYPNHDRCLVWVKCYQ